MNSKYLVATAAKPSLGHSCGGSGNRGCFGVVVVMISVVIVMRCGCGASCSGEKVKILFQYDERGDGCCSGCSNGYSSSGYSSSGYSSSGYSSSGYSSSDYNNSSGYSSSSGDYSKNESTHVVPIDSTTVDEGGKLSESFPEDVAYGTHDEDDVEETTALIDEHVEKSHH